MPKKYVIKHLGSILQKKGGVDQDVSYKLVKWHGTSVSYNCKVPAKLKGKFHKTTARQAMLYGAEWQQKSNMMENKGGTKE